jgi:hypothetical protein
MEGKCISVVRFALVNADWSYPSKHLGSFAIRFSSGSFHSLLLSLLKAALYRVA